ncbi:MAG: amidohydrolase family protein [Candidatus Eisenbacteria bacterium]|nr:amidohydrolase family protein [Candidatus Eisenbacteria bacterium]
MNPSREVLRADVLIENDVIAGVGRNVSGPLRSPSVSSGVRTLDVSGCYVLPGFVQTHVHLCQTLFKGQAEGVVLADWLNRIWALEAAHDSDSMRASAALGCHELLRGGTTCVLDMGSVHHTDQVFEAVRASGIRAFSGKAMMDAGDRVPPGLKETAEESMSEALRLHARWHGAEGGRLNYAFAPRFLESCSEGLLRSVAEKAGEMGLLVHSHASETADELADCKSRHGLTPVGYLESLGLARPNLALAHCVHLEDDDFKILAHSGVKVTHCPSCNLKLSSGIADVGRLVREGAAVSLGADGAPCNNNLDMFHEMRTAALLQSLKNGSGYPWAALFLEAATLGGAKALGISDVVGSVEPGKKADLIVIDVSQEHAFCGAGCDPATRIVFSARSSDVRHVFVDGRQVVAAGQIQQGLHAGSSSREVTSNAAGALERLLARCA